jgi:hypothetical protein
MDDYLKNKSKPQKKYKTNPPKKENNLKKQTKNYLKKSSKICSQFLLNLGANLSWGWLSSLRFSVP